MALPLAQDVRLEYLEVVAGTILKFKADRWNKMLSVEENTVLFTDFLEKPDVQVLVLTLNQAGLIVPCLGFPASLKTKGVYFIKKAPQNLRKDSFKEQLLFGDISPSPVEQLIAVVEEVGAGGRMDGGHSVGLVRHTGVQACPPRSHPLPGNVPRTRTPWGSPCPWVSEHSKGVGLGLPASSQVQWGSRCGRTFSKDPRNKPCLQVAPGGGRHLWWV